MTKAVRLNNEDRDDIASRLIRHRFQAEYTALAVRENAIALAAWKQIHGKYEAAMAKLPEGAFPFDYDIQVNAGGWSGTFCYGGSGKSWNRYRPDGRYGFEQAEPVGKLEFNDYGDHDTVNLTDPDLIDEARAVLTGWKELSEKVGTLYKKTRETLGKFTTFDSLLEKWPEAEQFIRARQKERGIYVAPSLPATLIFDLTKELELPPEEAEDGETVGT